MKKICAVCLLLVMLIGCFGITGFAAGTELVNETFDITDLTGWDAFIGKGGNYESRDLSKIPGFTSLVSDDIVGKGLKISVNKDIYKSVINKSDFYDNIRVRNNNITSLGNIFEKGDVITVEYQIMLSKKDGITVDVSPLNSWMLMLKFNADGKIYANNGASAISDWEAGRVYNITYLFNNKFASNELANNQKNEVSVYIDGEKKGDIYYLWGALPASTDSPNDDYNRIVYFLRPTANNYEEVGSCDIYLDNVRVTRYSADDTVDIKKPSFNADYASDGKVYFNGNNPVTVNEVKNTLNAASTSTVLMQKGGKILKDEEFVTEGTKVYEVTAGNVFEFDAVPVVNKMERTDSTVNTTLITHPNFSKMLTDSNLDKIEFPVNATTSNSTRLENVKSVSELYTGTDFGWMNDYVLSQDDGSTLTVEEIDAQKAALRIRNKFREAYISFNKNEQTVDPDKKLVIQGSYIYNALPYKKSWDELNSNTLMSYNGEELVSVMPDKRIQISPWFDKIDTDVKVSDNTEFTVAAIVDMKNWTYDVYINGSPAAKDVAINGVNNKKEFGYSRIWQRGESAGENDKNETFKDLYITDFSIYQPDSVALADISALTPGTAAAAPVKKLSISLWKDTDLNNVRLIKCYRTGNELNSVTLEKLGSNGIYSGYIIGNEPDGIFLWDMTDIKPLTDSIN
ncbi:hypothetical protein [Ructibacterium gallinarum]|uniref:Uncharacterized protein n=1 Tax=Ructibacterium gallinarum TaxID=2779355 RepID=A0A9D5M6X7_9FIRM|nr:hypothetical protein [Ructibacterium gallinarum]MBE5040669.1 hypothetical protein [Ructibacterium gallinarum]